ncbi:MAG: hypothetical protein DRI61_14050, partial [Chloroflexi bacterium]
MSRQPKVKVITLEHLLYGAIALAALCIRLGGPGNRPLNPDEATWAIAAWRFSQGMETPSGAISPVYLALSWLLFALFGSGDFTARLPGALAGGMLPLAFFLLRPLLGRKTALAAALLTAFSPLWVFASRSINGDIFVALLMVVALGAATTYVRQKDPGWLYLGAITLGVGLASGPSIYTYLVMWGLYLAYTRQPFLGQGELTKVMAALICALLLASTAFLLNPSGLGQAADLLPEWAQGLAGKAGFASRSHLLLSLLLYEPLMLLLAAAAVLLPKPRGGAGCSVQPKEAPSLASRTEANLVGRTLLLWFTAALLIQLFLGASGPGAILPALLPLTLLAAQGLAKLWDMWASQGFRYVEAVEAGLALAVLCYAYLTLAGYSLADAKILLGLAGIALLVTTSLFITIWLWRGGSEAIHVILATFLVICTLWTIRLCWGLNFGPLPYEKHLPVTEFTSPEVQDLVSSLERLSSYRTGDPYALSVTLVGNSPTLRRYLRRFENLKIEGELGRCIDATAVKPPTGTGFPR